MIEKDRIFNRETQLLQLIHSKLLTKHRKSICRLALDIFVTSQRIMMTTIVANQQLLMFNH